jgi:hypothetical protein
VAKLNLQFAIQKIIRLDEYEDKFIMDKVSESGIKSFQNYARHMLIQGEIIKHDYSELIGVRKEVSAIGRNVNQIVKYANRNKEISINEMKYLIDAFDEVKKLIASMIETERKAHQKEVL